MSACPCGMPAITVAGDLTFSAAWHREHMSHHLQTFPNIDERTVEILRDAWLRAVGREERAS